MKGTYLDDYITELTTITLDNVLNHDEIGEGEIIIISAKRYAPLGPYQSELELLKERVFTEISLKPLSEIRGLLIRLEQAKANIERAKAVFDAFKPEYGKEFDWYNFGLKYFTLFKIRLYGYEWQPDGRLRDYLQFAHNCKWLTLDWLFNKTNSVLLASSSDISNPIITPRKVEETPVFNSFPDLFFNLTDLKCAVEILYETTIANKLNVIDSNKNWLGKDRDGSRSVLLAWIEVLRVRGWFKIAISNGEMSRLLNGYFLGLNLSTTDQSLYRKQKGSSIASDYHAEFLQLIKDK